MAFRRVRFRSDQLRGGSPSMASPRLGEHEFVWQAQQPIQVSGFRRFRVVAQLHHAEDAGAGDATQFAQFSMSAKDRSGIGQGVSQAFPTDWYGPVCTGKQKSQELGGFAEGKAFAIYDAQGLRIVAVKSSAQGAYDAVQAFDGFGLPVCNALCVGFFQRSEEHTSELQLLMRISYAVFCSNNKKHRQKDDI